MAYSKKSRFARVDSGATLEQIAQVVSQMGDQLNQEFSSLERTVNPQGFTGTKTLQGPNNTTVTLTFKNGLLIS